ncbi:MAG: hypothetical protein NZ578_16695 [Candidatus Binatia bacterium]|nr:hypothetical protein [Candidatus Binatia bacterium]
MDPLSLMVVVTGAYAIIAVVGIAYLAGRGRPETRYAVVVVLLLLSAFFVLFPLVHLRPEVESRVLSSG